MRVRIKRIMDGPGPAEAVVTIRTASNKDEEVIVQKNQIEGDTLQVWRVGERGGSVLVELPQESASGNWRLWVDQREFA
jgi:hypothetical protein